MAATGFRYRTYADSGNATIANTAGSLITVLDDLLTGGSSPWTKTTNGTNDVTYQAPGGSQIKLRVYNNVAHTTSFAVRTTGQVGSGTIFPTTTQEAAANQGYCCVKARNSASTASTAHPTWYGIRTDRFMLLAVDKSSGGNGPGSVFIAGDLPVFDGLDPGLCVVGGYLSSNVATHVSTGDAMSPSGFANNTMGGVNVGGYANVAANGSTQSVPVFYFQTMPSQGYATVANSFGRIPLGRILVATTTATTGTARLSGAVLIRGYIPYLFCSPVDETAQADGDTFTDSGGNAYINIKSGSTNSFQLMTSDGEALP